MEADAPMQNDERDPRDLPPEDEPMHREEPPTDPPVADDAMTPEWPAGDAASAPEAAERDAAPVPPGDATDETASDGEDEFETASWPAQDSTAMPSPPAPDEGRTPPSEVEAMPPLPPDAGTAPGAGSDAVPAHTVPATEPGESTQCPRCGTENRPGIAFCRNCGQRLVAAGAPTTVARPEPPEGTQACPRCGTHNRAGVAFCQNCGANLRAVEPGQAPAAMGTAPTAAPRGGAVLGPVVLLIGAVGVAVAWLLPFAYASGGSLFDRAFGAPGGYGVAFWDGYRGISGLSSQAYFGFAAPAPLLVALLAVLAVAGFLRARPGLLQLIGLAVALAWAIGLAALFVIEELLGGPGGGLVEILSALTPGGIIFLLASMIVVIGTLTRFGRS
jgi:Double zinc ribbon